jgi:hypothetical protein
MPWLSKRSAAIPASDSAAFDDGGSGLLEACQKSFGPVGCEISCDARHTVWVKRADGSLSVGLPPWQLERHSVDELVERVSARLSR